MRLRGVDDRTVCRVLVGVQNHPVSRPRIPLRECVICANRAQSRSTCYLCGGLGFTTLRTFNKYKRGEIKKEEWLKSSGTPAPLARGEWITVVFSGGPHSGARLAWPVDQPPQIGQELQIPVEADLRDKRRSRQDPLFHEGATYVIKQTTSGLQAVHRTASKPPATG
jgi:hypothetical protein